LHIFFVPASFVQNAEDAFAPVICVLHGVVALYLQWIVLVVDSVLRWHVEGAMIQGIVHFWYGCHFHHV